MLAKLVALSIEARHLVLALFATLLVISGVSLSDLRLDAFPDVTNVQVSVNTEAQGLASEDIEQLVTYPIESAMYALPQVEEVRSISKTGLSIVTVVFKEGIDIYFARQLVFERLNSAERLIPDGVGAPTMGPNTSGLGQVFQYLLKSDDPVTFDNVALRSLNDWVVKVLLMPVEGITEVLSFGGEVKQYQVALSPSKLLAYGLTQEDVIAAIESNNVTAGGWYMQRGQEQLVVRGAGWFESGEIGLTQLKQVPVKTEGAEIVRLEQLAIVSFGSEIRQGAVTYSERDENGEIKQYGEVVSGLVLSRMGANTDETISSINRRVELIEKALPEGVSFKPVYDQSLLVDAAVLTIIKALLIASVLIIGVLAVFMANASAIILVVTAMIASVLITLACMAWFDISANLMSLGGLAIAIGILVDSAVVIVESIIRRNQTVSSSSLQALEGIYMSVNDVAKPIMFSSLIVLSVFLPLFAFEGVEAKLFEPMATTIMLAISIATVVALWVLPALAAIMMKQSNPQKKKQRVWRVFEDKFTALLVYLMAHTQRLIFALVLITLASAYFLTQLGSEFVPELEEGTLNIRVTLAPSASLETALALAPKLENALLAFPEVTYALSRIGRPEIGGDPEPVSNIEIYIGLKPMKEWTTAKSRQALQAEMANALNTFPGMLLTFSQPIATRVDELLSGVKAQLAIKLYGPEIEVLQEKGAEIEKMVSAVEGTADVAIEQMAGELQLVVTPKRAAMSRYGLSVSDVMSVVQNGIGGQQAGQIIHGNERYDINVRFSEHYRASTKEIENIMLQSPTGAWVKLEQVATVSFKSGSSQIRRDNIQRRITIQANIKHRDMGNVVSDIKHVLDTTVNLPDGYTIKIGGQYESQQRAQAKLFTIIPLCVLMIGFLLFSAFQSIKLVGLVMVCIPLSTLGGVWGLYFSGHYLSVPSAIGFIGLFGIAVLNGVVLIESIHRRRLMGGDVQDAVIEGTLSRLRPVLITAMTTCFALLPVIMSSGVGAEVHRPLAVVVLGGLISSTLLTLIVLPCLYLKVTRK
ncbi:CusA/CzcA family heavy metal efflux RND transporter [Aestuariibacter sp. AA17]|uniref:CusA/CzcA family heavy metal efflux RND transporter n=1 Tax=Fluctibacter corallii TaxID=2984329 RepID=A0ABT3A4V2_9ALTE|nr:CusA/CzcA family heavy metal efflux RND transporter [Aestuariibacter sp. AA17]MCV2883669.1 CusA/CzcA family heavy metal efflux RND transporter [Aestuariibacter sp. AA17]